MMLAVGLVAAPAAAQFSDSYKFLKAVRDGDGTKVMEVVKDSGSTLINTRGDDGDAALHIVVKRRDVTWLGFLIGRGARADIKDAEGNTPLALAARIGFSDGVSSLIGARAGVNVANNQGETPLILAVQARDPVSVRLLLAAGANPALTDRAAGLSARDYAARDRRSAMILKLIDDAKPVKPAGPVAGPRL
jgi:ankyrin repeat protein